MNKQNDDFISIGWWSTFKDYNKERGSRVIYLPVSEQDLVKAFIEETRECYLKIKDINKEVNE
jgi:hypothetical protein